MVISNIKFMMTAVIALSLAPQIIRVSRYLDMRLRAQGWYAHGPLVQLGCSQDSGEGFGLICKVLSPLEQTFVGLQAFKLLVQVYVAGCSMNKQQKVQDRSAKNATYRSVPRVVGVTLQHRRLQRSDCTPPTSSTVAARAEYRHVRINRSPFPSLTKVGGSHCKYVLQAAVQRFKRQRSAARADSRSARDRGIVQRNLQSSAATPNSDAGRCLGLFPSSPCNF